MLKDKTIDARTSNEIYPVTTPIAPAFARTRRITRIVLTDDANTMIIGSNFVFRVAITIERVRKDMEDDAISRIENIIRLAPKLA